MSLGIENVKPAIKAAAEIRNVAAAALADGKFTALEAFGFVPVLSQLPAIIQSGPTILAELKDADHVERAELEAYAINELGIAKENVEQFIADALDWAIASLQLYASGRASLA